MNVLYDISALGIGHFLDRARTGIARVVENLAIELTARPELELYFSAYQSLDTGLKASRYLKSQDALDASRLCVPTRLPFRVGSMMLSLLGTADPMSTTDRRLLSRARRKLVTIAMKPGQRLVNQVDADCVRGKQILHTPFLPFPQITGTGVSPRRFITIYDLIPILFPQFFQFDEERDLKRAIEDIGPEDFAFAISESTKNDLCEFSGIDPGRVFVTPLAASDNFRVCADEEEKRAIRARYGIPDTPYVLSLCTLEPRKNIDQTIRCFVRLVTEQRVDDLNLVLVGAKGWDFEKIFDELDQSDHVKDRVFITGYVPDQDLSPLYSGARMFVYPSIYEGFGLPPLEAMQCGVPVISSNTSSLPEVVGDAGIMLDPKDADALCQAMLDLHRSEALRTDLAERGVARARQFSWQACAEETVKGYRAAL